MALYVWKCESCQKITKKLLNTRPDLGTCDCGGELRFDSKVGSRTMEVIDNGLMVKAVERPVNIESMVRERNQNS